MTRVFKKTEMHGTGGGRWETREDAKRMSRKLRRRTALHEVMRGVGDYDRDGDIDGRWERVWIVTDSTGRHSGMTRAHASTWARLVLMMGDAP